MHRVLVRDSVALYCGVQVVTATPYLAMGYSLEPLTVGMMIEAASPSENRSPALPGATDFDEVGMRSMISSLVASSTSFNG